MTILVTIGAYFALLYIVSRLTGRSGNDAFFRGNRQSPWFAVAFGMIGASLSGVTFVSVPGMVTSIGMRYMQMCIGFFFGYLIVAFVLLPLYYKHNLTSIYTYLGTRFGNVSRKTGASFFLLSKLTGAAARLYLVCMILQRYVFDSLGIPYVVTVVGTLALIWMYTHRSGIRTLVWTDTLQTAFLFIALILILWKSSSMLGLGFTETWSTIWNDPQSKIFEWDDIASKQYFWKQFLSGVFIVIVMTGLDQDMMQKNLTCKNLRDAQKDMCSYGLMFIPANFLFLSMGILITMIYAKTGTPMPASSDSMVPDIIVSGKMGKEVIIFFTIGVIASAFSSADSALTALTTSFCVDILDVENPGSRYHERAEKVRKLTHIVMMIVFILFILAFKSLNNTSVIDAIYVLAGYTYGPLLGLFAFGMFTHRIPNDRHVPLIAILSPLACYAIDTISARCFGYKFGYELLMLNGILTFAGLYLSSRESSGPITEKAVK